MAEIIDLAKARYPDLGHRRVVIAGGTGDVGEGIIRAWVKSGAHVVVPSRTDRKIDELRGILSDLEGPGRVDFVSGDSASFEDAEEMAKLVISEFGPVTDIVASIGGWWQKNPLWEISDEDWQSFFVSVSSAHVATVRAWVPHLPQSGTYQLILGGSAQMPVPGASIINMQQAALLMMRKVLTAELGDRLRVTSQVLGPVVTRAREHVDPNWVANGEVGLVSAAIAAGPAVTGVDFVSYEKSQMLETLVALKVYPG